MANNSTTKAVNEVANILSKIIDAKEEKNLTEKNKKIALEDTLKLLNRTMKVLQEKQNLNLLTVYQTIYFRAINKILKKIKYPLIEINNSLWRVYVISLFKAKNLNQILKNYTTWDVNNLEKEKITYDMKLILLSMIHLNDEDEENNTINK